MSEFFLDVDVTNPGQFFACCGLFEVTDRCVGDAVGWFDGSHFRLSSSQQMSLGSVIGFACESTLEVVDPRDETASPLDYRTGKNPLRLDWWKAKRADGASLKTWAGRMQCSRIARAMQGALRSMKPDQHLLDHGQVVFEPESGKKVEPFYFDARRAANAHPLDVGFAHDPLDMQALAFPAVEFLTLVGLQRFRPMPMSTPRVFEYRPWTQKSRPLTASVALTGELGATTRLRFESAFRTDQRKHKAFATATKVERA